MLMMARGQYNGDPSSLTSNARTGGKVTGLREPSVVYLSDAVSRLERAVARIGSLRLRPWHMTLSGYAAMRVLEGQPDLSLAQVSRRCDTADDDPHHRRP